MQLQTNAQEQLNNLTEFLEDQIWYTKKIAEEKKVNLAVVRSPRTITEEGLNSIYWLLQDMKAVMSGEL
jgi:hypothetical protein